MRHLLAVTTVALTITALIPASIQPASAGGWHSWDGYSSYRAPRRAYRVTPRAYNGNNLRYYNSPRAYRSSCGYGDCGCLRAMALRTGDQHWWDKYQACTG